MSKLEVYFINTKSDDHFLQAAALNSVFFCIRNQRVFTNTAIQFHSIFRLSSRL